MSSGRRPRGAQFSIGHILGDPFALATISISILGWLIALVGSVITQIHGADFNKFYWWALAYMFCCIIGVTLVVLSGLTEQYALAVVGFLAVAVTYNTFAVSSVVFSNDGAQEAAAAGYILLSMVSLLWIGYFGSSPQTKQRGYVDSFALNKEQRQSMNRSRPMSTNNPYDTRANATGNAPNQGLFTSAQMGGMESSTARMGFGSSGAVNGGPNGSQPRFGGPTMGGGSAPRSPPPGMGAPPAGGMNGGIGGGMGGMGAAPAGPSMGAPMGGAPMGGSGPDMTTTGMGGAPPAAGAGGDGEQYPYRAKAIYSYEANPDDANEISFTKHEILEVSDVSGRWWQAKKENGETGIAPSNYLILL